MHSTASKPDNAGKASCLLMNLSHVQRNVPEGFSIYLADLHRTKWQVLFQPKINLLVSIHTLMSFYHNKQTRATNKLLSLFQVFAYRKKSFKCLGILK